MVWTFAAAVVWLGATASGPVAGLPGELRRERHEAHHGGEPTRELELVEQELAALAASGADPPQILGRQCDALQAGFQVCGERLPELGCEASYLRRYADAGCLRDPLELPRYHSMWAGYWQRRMDFAAALAALREASAAAYPLFLARLFRQDRKGADEFLDVTRDLAAGMAMRTEIAAHLRNRAALARSSETLAIYLDALAHEGDAFAAAVMRNQVAWGLLVLREAGLDVGDPAPLLASALQTFVTAGTDDRAKADNVRINLALAALQRGALAEVDREVAALTGAALSPEERMWLLIVRLRAALARGEPAQASAWQRELAGAEVLEFVPMGAWFAAWTRGLVDEARGERAAAVAAYEAAEAVLEAHAHARDGAAYGAAADGRYRMFAATTRRLVELLVGDGDDVTALRLARSARSRALRMHAREWCQEAERPRDDSPPPGELRLLYFPLDRAAGLSAGTGSISLSAGTGSLSAGTGSLSAGPGSLSAGPGSLSAGTASLSAGPGNVSLSSGTASLSAGTGVPDGTGAWIGFAASSTAIRAELLAVDPVPADAHRLSEGALSIYSQQLLAPFEAELAAAELVTVFAADALHGLPFHALPWEGGVLLDAAPVQYGLDIAACGAPARDDRGLALVVSGSDYALPEEGEAVAATLRAGGVAVEHRPAGAADPFAPLLAGEAALAHLAAHGQHPADEAVFAADVQLAFGDGRVLTREAILGATAVPPIVYLSACRSSFVDADTLGGGLSLAHAFLLRGARHVVGSVRDVDADATRSFALGFYRSLAARRPDELAEAWREAWLAARATLEPSLQADLRMLRLLVP